MTIKQYKAGFLELKIGKFYRTTLICCYLVWKSMESLFPPFKHIDYHLWQNKLISDIRTPYLSGRLNFEQKTPNNWGSSVFYKLSINFYVWIRMYINIYFSHAAPDHFLNSGDGKWISKVFIGFTCCFIYLFQFIFA